MRDHKIHNHVVAIANRVLPMKRRVTDDTSMRIYTGVLGTDEYLVDILVMLDLIHMVLKEEHEENLRKENLESYINDITHGTC